jgi:hypothetical protein
VKVLLYVRILLVLVDIVVTLSTISPSSVELDGQLLMYRLIIHPPKHSNICDSSMTFNVHGGA